MKTTGKLNSSKGVRWNYSLRKKICFQESSLAEVARQTKTSQQGGHNHGKEDESSDDQGSVPRSECCKHSEHKLAKLGRILGYHNGQRQGGRCASWQNCSGSGFIPRPSRQPSYHPYEQGDGYDDRDFDEELPYDPYQRTITLPVPGLPSGTEKIIEGMFDLILNNR